MKTISKNITIDQKLCLHFIFKHKIAFRDFFIPQATNKIFYTYYYQYAPALCDELVWAGARGTGKSFDLEFSIMQNPYLYPGEETFLTAFRKTHVKDRLEKVITYIANVPYLRKFLIGNTDVSLREAVTRTPIYSIRFKNGHEICGISTGEDPQAVMIQGHHPKLRFIEEGQFYTSDAWMKYQNTQAPSGSTDRYYGVSNGILDSPFYEITHRLKKFRNKKFRVHRAMEPNWNQELKREKLATLKGPNSNDWLQQIEAQDGEPSFGVWNEADIRKNIDFTESKEIPGLIENQIRVITILAKDYVNMDACQVLCNLPSLPEGVEEVIVGIDAGYSQPTIILPFFKHQGKWNLNVKILLLDRMISDDQTELVDYVLTFYKAYAGIDCTSADGRDIATKLCNPKNEQYKLKQYDKRIFFIDFREAIITGYKRKKEGNVDVLEEIKDHMKNLTTRILREKFYNAEFLLNYDEEMIPEFISETQKTDSSGRVSISTPSDVHIPEAYRCFSGAWWKLHVVIEKPPLDEMNEEENYEMQFPIKEENTLNLFKNQVISPDSL